MPDQPLDAAALAIRNALSLFRSVIHCGEPWTPTCEDAYRAAQAGVNKLRAAHLSGDSAP